MKEERLWSNKGLLEEKQDILRWMDANDAHMSLPANERLRIINEQLSKMSGQQLFNELGFTSEKG